MKTMTELENIIMNRTVCDRATANLIANDILTVAERNFAADIRREVALEIIGEIWASHTPDIDGFFTMHECELANLKKKYVKE